MTDTRIQYPFFQDLSEKYIKVQVCAVYCSNWDAVKLGFRVIEIDG